MSVSLPAFARAAWYVNPTDRRCPLDAELESLDLRPPARGQRHASLRLRLLAADHTTRLVFRYTGVVHHALTCYTCDQGMGVWLRDEFAVSGPTLTHRITWRSPAGGFTHWLVEAERVHFLCRPSAATRGRRRV